LRLSKAEVQENLREGHHRTAGSNHGVQGWFVAIEIGLALVLLVGAGLLIRSLENVWALNPGFDPENVLTCDVSFSMGRMATAEKAVAVVGELKDEVTSIPGAKSVAIVLGGLPFELNSEVPVWPDEKPKPEKLSAWPLAVSYVVGPDYFKTMRIPLLRGRAFTQEDNASAPPVVIIDDDLAKSMFAGDPIGKKVDFGAGTRPAQVVGVVGHVAQSDRFEKGKPVVDFQTYSPSLQAYAVLSPLAGNAATILVRTTGSLESLVGPIRQVVHSLDANAVVYDVRTMHQVIAASLAERRFSMVLLGTFAGIALALAAIGIYGVASYLVGQRTHEIGIRMALGAQPRDILRDVLGEGGKMAAAGIALGLAASLGLTRLMTSMLFGVSATDPLTLAAVVAVLLAVALLACWIPARRAIRIDPMVALRHE
jgi:predicted permease